MKKLVVLLFCGFVLIAGLSAQQAGVKVAFTGVRNLDIDPRSDYVGGIIQGLVLYDLTRAQGIVLVDRNSLDKVLREQELQLSGLLDNTDTGIKIGKLIGADFLVSVDYVAMSSEVLVTIKVIHVASGRTGAFVERGGNENVVHKAAESLVQYLTGVKPAFISKDGERNIVSLKNEDPGTIALHSRLIRAEIFLDGVFVGYTNGNIEVPFIIEKVKTGKHTVRVHLGKAFGVVKLPEVVFMDWQVEFDLQPGERKVLRDETTDFNSVLYGLQNLRYESFYWNEKNKAKVMAVWQKKFQDRNGKEIEVSLTLNPSDTATGFVLSPVFTVNGETRMLTLVANKEKTVSVEAVIGIVKLVITIERGYDQPYINISIERTDVWQGMFSE